mmetsp:Transcript_40536/g.90087  ORF Transcript_40536/g.90087 Transcript_40536/m.90087 type:complete len:91 (+) Transcript_40536:94-366(+)
MSSAFGGPRTISKPPEKGVFPLDHFGECKQIAQAYLQCLDAHEGEASPCKDLSKRYLECRMARNLMAPQELSELGLQFGEQQQQQQPAEQ